MTPDIGGPTDRRHTIVAAVATLVIVLAVAVAAIIEKDEATRFPPALDNEWLADLQEESDCGALRGQLTQHQEAAGGFEENSPDQREARAYLEAILGRMTELGCAPAGLEP